MRISLIGPGDVEFYFKHMLKKDTKWLKQHIDDIAETLVEVNATPVLLPDKGISLEIARRFKELGGKTVIGTVPFEDVTFGIVHLQKYMELKVNGKPLFSQFINTGDWFKQDLIMGLHGEKCLVLGFSLGALGELTYALYLLKLIKGVKISVEPQRIHPALNHNYNNFSVILYKPFLITTRFKELESYANKINVDLIYVKTKEELRAALVQT